MTSAAIWAASALLALTGTPAALGATPPPAPSAPATPEVHSGKGDLDAQLAMAQSRLEQAAHEVARLSTQLSGNMLEQVMPFVSAGHPIIGVQLEAAEDQSGARVREVSPGGPAEEAGMRAGDVIVAVNGVELKGPESTQQLMGVLRSVKPETRVHIRALRGGKAQEFTVTARGGLDLLASVRELPEMIELEDWSAALLHRPLGELELATLTPRLGTYFGTNEGVLVVRAPAEGALKLEDGDVILAIDGRQPTSGSHATRILSSYQPGEKFTLRIVRQHKTLELQATLPETRHGPLHHAGGQPPAHPAASASSVAGDHT